MDEMKEEIVFLEAELLDDDDDAPVGTLVDVADEQELEAEVVLFEDEEPAPAEEPQAEEQPQELAAEEPAPQEEEAPAEEPAQEVVEEPVEEQVEAEEAPAQEEQPAEEPQSEPVVAEEPAQEEPAPEEKPVQEKTEEPAPAEKPAPKPKKAPAKKAEPVAEEPKKAPAKRKSTSISLDDNNVNSALADSNFEVKDSKPATIVKSKKVKEDDVWQVAPVIAAADTKEEPKKAPAKKAPAKKAEPASEEPKKALAKAAATKNTKATEEKKMAAKDAKPAPAPKKADDKNQEKVLIAGDPNVPHGKFVIKVTDNGNYVYKLFSSNKRVVAIGAQPYPALPSCKTGIQSVIKNAGSCPIEDQTLQKPVEQKCPKWIIYLDKKGEYRLRLIASNGNIVATTNDGYLSKDAAKKGIDAIARAAVGADVVRNDNLW